MCIGEAVRWIECEDAHLRKHWKRREPEQLAAELGRSVSAVKRRAREFGLGKGWIAPHRRGYVAHSAWTPERDAEMLRLLGTVDDDELARMIGRSVSAINSRLSVLAARDD